MLLLRRRNVVIFALQTGLVAIERVRGIPNKSIAAVAALIGIFLINSSWNAIVSAATEIYEKDAKQSDLRKSNLKQKKTV